MALAVTQNEVIRIAREVAGIVRQFVSNRTYRVFLFGSWASGNAGERSDIDIGIEGPTPMDAAAMCDIRDAVEALPTMYSVDVVDLRQVDPRFRTLATTHIMELEGAE
jgi:predicted nucleotidyltransferase